MAVVFVGIPTAMAVYTGFTTHDDQQAEAIAEQTGRHLGENYGPLIGWSTLGGAVLLALSGRMPGTRWRTTRPQHERSLMRTGR
jgi:hypothetical protein